MYKSSENLPPSCSSSEDLVAYLYSEMSTAGQAAFEDHLTGCDSCTADFAELSLARLGVYEWHRDEFVELATPRVVIPYGEAAAVSWFDAVRAFFASPLRLAAGASLTALTIVAGVLMIGPKEIEVADVVPGPSPVQVGSRNEETPQPKVFRSPGEAEDPRPAVTKEAPPASRSRPVKAAESKDVKIVNPRPASVKTPASPTRTASPRRAPRLNDFEDEDDNTLRLGDLLAEVDTRD